MPVDSCRLGPQCSMLFLLTFCMPAQSRPDTSPVQWFDASALTERAAEEGRAWLPFLQPGSLTCGIYRLAAGSEDRQTPHAQDEVYHVLEGKARLRAGSETRDVPPGSVVFVAGGVPHRFLDIEEDLVVLVFFSAFRGTTGGMAAGPRPTKQTAYPEASQRGNARIFYWFRTGSAGQMSIDYGQPVWKPAYEQFMSEPSGRRWRLGENFWTTLDTNMDLEIGGVELPVGQHYLVLQNVPEIGMQLVALDPRQVREKRLDAYEAPKTRGGIVVPMEVRELDEHAARLRFDLHVNPAQDGTGTLEIRFGPYALTAPLQMHPAGG